MGGGMSKILDGLFLGNIRDSEDKETLAKNGITHILSVYNSAKPVLEDMTYLCIQASDSSNQNLIQHFKECITFIHECRLHGGGCLVHCLAGVSRSTTVLVAYLMTVSKFGWEDCIAAVKAIRSYVGPNFGFQQQLQEFEVKHVKEYRDWLQSQYGRNPFNDQEELQKLFSKYEEQKEHQEARSRENRWINPTSTVYPLPYNAYGGHNNSWSNR
ncbi:dual specificity protein phosphatase 22-A-like [Protopterus annectens]|uniref:dual specificity protein phosphatase 22-A-like n=1 Tax=Protopterus annectens TaxID=7888 RepID=UPI001CFA1EFE|nr:dual specificity protein phosphatase 22-A-like [Protopterus annectens]